MHSAITRVVQQKTQLLLKQKQQAQRLLPHLKTCQEVIEHNLMMCTPQQILTEKDIMIDEMNTAIETVDLLIFQPIEKANTVFEKRDFTVKDIGAITSTTSPWAFQSILVQGRYLSLIATTIIFKSSLMT